MLMPLIVGAAVVGGFYASVALADRSFTWSGLLGFAGSGAVACVLSRAVANQPGSAELLRSILITNDKMTEVAASLDESMITTHQKLDREQAVLAKTNENMARLQAGLSNSNQAISYFSDGVFAMASGHRQNHYQQSQPDTPPTAEVPDQGQEDDEELRFEPETPVRPVRPVDPLGTIDSHWS